MGTYFSFHKEQEPPYRLVTIWRKNCYGEQILINEYRVPCGKGIPWGKDVDINKFHKNAIKE